MILRTIATACLFALPAVAALAQDADITGDAAKGRRCSGNAWPAMPLARMLRTRSDRS